MIERFNFYDVYGYLMPGIALFGVFTIPGFIGDRRAWPADLGTALIAVIAAYIAGHVLQAMAHRVVPATINGRFPSDLLLDANNTQLDPATRLMVTSEIRRSFNIDVVAGGSAARNAAFILCRNAVVAAKATPYVEQFNALYVLMRGICAAFAIGCAYTIGWIWRPFVGEGTLSVANVLFFAAASALVLVFRFNVPQSAASRLVYGLLLLTAVVFAGLLSSSGSVHEFELISAAALFWLFAALLSFNAYRAFATEFARSVYQDFHLMHVFPPKR